MRCASIGAAVVLAAVLAGEASARPEDGEGFDGFMRALAAPALDVDSAGQPVNPAMRTGEQPESTGHLRTFEMPAITVEGQPAAALREEDLVGPYGQPRWTTGRRFPTTRVYVIPEGKVEMEAWYRLTPPRHGQDVEARALAEVEVGLPNRFQLDVYFRTDQDDIDSTVMYGQQIELRWALADWGRIWGNPTLYFEYIQLDSGRADRIEPKLLLGGEIATGWHWGANFVMEWEIDGPDKVHEYEFDGGISYTVVDSKFDVGAEMKVNYADESGSRGHFEDEWFAGPSFQWKPMPRWTINVAPLIGITHESPAAQITLNTGWEF